MTGENKYHILVVEDDAGDRALYERILQNRGYSVSTAESYQKAVEIIKNESFDIALIDIELDKNDRENADGLRVVAQLNKLENRPQVILGTGWSARVTPAWRDAVYAVWEKSGSTQTLLDIINQALTKKEELSPAKIKNTLNSILSKMAREQLNLGQVLELILNEMATLINAEAANLSLVDNNKIKVKASTIGKGGLNKEFDVENSVVGLAVRRQKTVNIPDIENDELAFTLFKDALGKDNQKGSEFAVPLMVNLEPIAVINFESKKKFAFKEADINHIEELAGQVAIAINSARLQDQTNKVKNLSEISSEINTAVHKPELEFADKALEKIMQFMMCDKAAIFHYDEGHSIMEFLAQKGLGQEYINLDITLDSPRTMVIKTREPIVVSDIETDERFSSIKELANIGKFKSFIELPLLLPNKLIGSITAYYNRPHYFESEEIALDGLFADHIAIAFNNAQQYQLLLEAQTREKMAAMGALSADLVHRLNSPLSAIRANLMFIQLNCLEELKNAYLKNKIEEIFSITQKAIDMVESMRNQAREDIFDAPINIEEILGDTLKGIEIPSHIKLINYLIDSQIPPVKANKHIGKVFQNLISNAIKAMPEGMPNQGKLIIDASLVGTDIVELTFEDSGIGIPPDWKDSIFNILSVFAKGAEHKGQGLGLWYSKAYIEACGGKLPPPDSEVGKGTKFTIRLNVWKGAKQ